jgi:hypothetical protein
MYYYFDIEATGLEPGINTIITIQYAKLANDFSPISELTILKVWEFNSEKKMLQTFLNASKIFDDPFTFIPVGDNVLFDITFTYKRARFYKLVTKPFSEIITNKPFVDIKHILIVLNDGFIRGYNHVKKDEMKSGIRNKNIPEFYINKQYDRIITYIQDEFNATIQVLKTLHKILINNKHYFQKKY